MNKAKRLVIALVIVCCAVMGAMFMREQSKDYGQKTVHIMIKVDDKVIYDEDEKTDVATLGELLKEMKEEGNIKVEIEKGQYGDFIVAMGVEDLVYQDMASQKFWTYNSVNNKTCVSDGYCSSADLLNINDQDEFVFEYSQIKY